MKRTQRLIDEIRARNPFVYFDTSDDDLWEIYKDSYAGAFINLNLHWKDFIQYIKDTLFGW